MKQLLQRVALMTAICGSALAMHGQATNSGDIRGTVTDSTGALLPDVTVTVTNITPVSPRLCRRIMTAFTTPLLLWRELTV